MVELLGTLVTSESPSGHAAALTTTAMLLARRGTELLGQESEWLATGNSPILRWQLPAQSGGHGRPILLLAHLDTVWPLGTATRWPFSVTDGHATGPGCFDMKAGLVQALFAMAELRRSQRPSPGVVLLVTSDEEVGSPSGRQFIEADAADAASGARARGFGRGPVENCPQRGGHLPPGDHGAGCPCRTRTGAGRQCPDRRC